MDAEQASADLGAYFRFIVRRKSENSAHAAIHGVGVSSKNPFTGATQTYKAPESLAKLSVFFKKHRLDQDPAFVAALGAAISDVTEEPISYLLSELEVLQENGDGGPDPAFELRLDHETPANMTMVVKAFERTR